MRELGVEVNVVEDRQAFVDRVEPLWAKYRDVVGEEWFERVLSAK